MSDSDELMYIYAALRKLRCFSLKQNQEGQSEFNVKVFPNTFLLKQLEERLEELDVSANNICNELFKLVSGKPKEASPSAREKHKTIDLQNDATARFPQFDEFFHSCLVKLYDFVIGIDWHELDIRQLSKSDSSYVSENLKFVSSFFKFQDALVDLVNKDESRRFPMSLKTISIGSKHDSVELNTIKGKKSNLRNDQNKRDSPRAERRVRFRDLDPVDGTNKESSHGESGGKFRDNHSVFALDLLIYAINVYIQRLADRLVTWSTEAQADLDRVIESIFDSKVKLRSKQLQMIAKRIKIYNDVHLTVLDHLSEIKLSYLVRATYATLLSQDSRKLVRTYKKPRIRIYLRKIGLEIEVNILLRLTRQCLQIFFNLIVCEINANPTDASGKVDDKNRHTVTNFVLNWLKVDHVLFGRSEPKVQRESLTKQLDDDQPIDPAGQIKRPQLVAKTSTLSLNGRYRSSSRILSQIDNLSEFMREFIVMISDRLREEQQLKYFLEVISTGLAQMFQLVSPQLEQQLSTVKSNEGTAKPTTTSKGLSLKVDTTRYQPDGNQEADTLMNTNLSLDMLAIKLRCLKFIHVVSMANKIVLNEASNRKIELDCDLDLDMKLAQFTRICMEAK